MNCRDGTILSVAVLSLTAFSNAWVPQRFAVTSRISSLSISTIPYRRQRRVLLSPGGSFFGPEEEFICPDEEECEIDWDRMPEFTSDGDEDESDVDLQPRPTYGSLAQASLDRGRVRLEMNWQIEECESDTESCSDFCPECAGSGRQPCRFCRGTGMIVFGKDFRSCLICADAPVIGQEDCSACRGTGQIAPWASTMSEHLQAKSDGVNKQIL
jgi:hypothetical protein